MRTILPFIIIIAILSSCVFNERKPKHSVSENVKTNFSYKENEDLIKVDISNDTLLIVTTDLIAYFPFGKFSNKDELLNRLNKFTITEEQGQEIRLSHNNSKIKYVFDEEQNVYHIVSGDIQDSDIVFENNIHIGITKKILVSKYLTDFKSKPDSYNVVVLESGLTGIWHYYEFRNNNLIRIKFDTDYQLEK
jgi:hypothetical protein